MMDTLIALWLSADAWIVWRLLRASRISELGSHRVAVPDAWLGEDKPVSLSSPNRSRPGS